MRSPVLAIGCAALVLTMAGCQDRPTTPIAKPSPSRTSPTPTPSTPTDVAAAIRRALSRAGTAEVTLLDSEGSATTVSHFRIDCSAPRPRAEIRTTVPGRAGQPARLHVKVITDGTDLYSTMLNWKDGKPWYQGKIGELETKEFLRPDQTYFPTMNLYIANCDQPAVFALSTKAPARLSTPGEYKATISSAKAAKESQGYSKEFYDHALAIGANKVHYTLWMNQGFHPAKYQITVGNNAVQAAKWVVRFSDWRVAPISLPPKNLIRNLK